MGLEANVPKPCTDCHITSITPDLEYDADPGPGENWVQANYGNGGQLHHMVLFNTGVVDATCGNVSPFSLLGDRFFASGDERGTATFPSGFGYYVSPTALFSLNYMIHNVSVSTTKTFRVKATFVHHPASDNIRTVRHVWLDQGYESPAPNCGGSEYGIGTGYSHKHWDWTSGSAPGTFDDVEGTVIGIGGHVHDWGLSVAAEKVQTSQNVCTSRAGYAMGSGYAPVPVAPGDVNHPGAAVVENPGDPVYSGHIESMEGCPGNVAIAPGTTLRLHTQYNSIAPVGDVMGIMTAIVYDNCPSVPNPTQADFDDDLDGDPCDTDMDGDGTPNSSDADDDNDGYSDSAEGGTPLCGNGANNDPFDAGGTDTVVDDGCPGGPALVGTYSEGQFNISTITPGRCEVGQTVPPSSHWPADLAANGAFSGDKINVSDLASFVAPNRRIGTKPGDTEFSARHDLVPGTTFGTAWINVADLSSVTLLTPPMPPYNGTTKAFGGPVCTDP